MDLQLIRSETLEKEGEPVQTIGWLYVRDANGQVIDSFATLELPWNNNKTGVSCIPPAPGDYKIYKNVQWDEDSPSFPYEHYWVKDVKGRTYIKIHRGNYYTQIEGCILIGLDHTDINEDGVVDVVSSEEALKRLVGHLGKDTYELHIKFLG